MKVSQEVTALRNELRFKISPKQVENLLFRFKEALLYTKISDFASKVLDTFDVVSDVAFTVYGKALIAAVKSKNLIVTCIMVIQSLCLKSEIIYWPISS